MRRSRLLLLATAVLTMACGGEPPPPLAQTAPATAPAATSAALVSAAPSGGTFARAATLAAEQPGYRYTFEVAMRGIPDVPGSTFTFGGAGSVDQRSKRSSVSIDFRGVRELLLSGGDMTAAELDRFLGDGTIDLIQDGGTYYLRMPYLATLQGATTPWVSVSAPVGETTDLGLGGFGTLGGLGGLGNPGTPADYLEHLKSIDSAIVVVGTEQVRGVTTTRYRGALNLGTLLTTAARTPEERAQLEASLALFAGFSLPYDVWIDADGLPRRLSTTLDFGAFAAAGSGTVTGPPAVAAPSMVFAYELFDFGNPGNIDVPASSQVTAIDLDELAALEGFGF